MNFEREGFGFGVENGSGCCCWRWVWFEESFGGEVGRERDIGEGFDRVCGGLCHLWELGL